MPIPNNQVNIGYHNAKHFTNPDKDVRPAFFDNEDLGFKNAIPANDAFEGAIPNPSDIDLDNEKMVYHWMEIVVQRNDRPDLDGNLTVEALDLTQSMFNIDFDTVNPANILDDVNSLEFKKAFMGPDHLRMEAALLEHAGGSDTAHMMINSDDIGWGARKFVIVPPEPIQLFLPLYLQWINRSITFTTVDLATIALNAAFAAASTEFVGMRMWYTRERLTSAEKNVLEAFKFLRLTA